MEKKVLIDQFQKVTEEDFNNFGHFPQASLDHVVKDLGYYGRAFTGFACVQAGPALVTVGAGRFYKNGEVYFNDTDGGLDIDLLTLLPPVTRRIIAITVWGVTTEAESEPRTFLQDANTRATIARAKSTEEWRWANIGPVAGTAGPDPTRPAIPADVLVVAYVTVDNAGIVSIEAATDNRATNVQELDARLDENDIWRRNAGTRLDTLGSDLTGLGAKIKGLAQQDFVNRLAADMARVKDEVNLPDDYTAWGADHFVNEDESDTAHADYAARVEEGVRPPAAATNDMPIALLNPVDDKVIVTNNFMLPAYDAVTRVQNVGNDFELSIASAPFQTVTSVQLQRSRTRIRYGSERVVSPSSAWFQSGRYDPVSNVFTRGGETWQSVYAGAVYGLVGYSGAQYRLKQFWVDTYDEPYWENQTVEEGISGSVVAETFPVTQAGFLVELGLYFTRKALTGDVNVLICQTTGGAPDTSKVIARSLLDADDIALWPARTPVAMPATLLQPGRYAIVLISAGNHFLAQTGENKFADGTSFNGTDGAWFMGDTLKDMAFDAKFAKFKGSRIEVQLNPLQLAGGIADIDLNFDSALPAGTDLVFEFQKAGVWTRMASETSIGNLPALLPFRAVFIGTPDIMPGIGVGANSRARTTRGTTSLRHISKERTTGANVNTIHVDVRIENWRGPTYNTADVNIRTGGGTFATIVDHAAMTERPAPENPNAIIRQYTFTVTPLSSYKIEILATTDDVTLPPLVSERVDVALTT